MATDSSVAAVPLAWPRRHLGKLALLVVVVAWLIFAAPDSPVFMALVQWSPALAKGFGQNILISLVAIGLGTVVGLLIGALALLTIAMAGLVFVVLNKLVQR